MDGLITANTLQRALTGLVHQPHKESFAKTGAGYRAYQDGSSSPLRALYHIKNWITDILAGRQYSSRVSDKESGLCEHFDSIARAILTASKGRNLDKLVGQSIDFFVDGSKYRIEEEGEPGSTLVIRQGSESVLLECTLADLKSAMFKAYLAEQQQSHPGSAISLAGFELSGISLSDTELVNCDFSGVNMRNAVFANCKFHHCNFSDAKLGNSVFARCRFFGANFSRVEMRGAFIRNSEFQSTDFFDAELTKTCIQDTALLGANFLRTDLRDSTFISVDTTEANFVALTEGFVPLSLPPQALPDPINPKDKTHFDILLDLVTSKAMGEDAEVGAVLCKILQHLRRITGEPTAANWAKISLELEKILKMDSVDWQSGNGIKLGFAKKGIAHLELIARLNWAKLEHDVVVTDMAAYFEKIWDFAHSNFTTLGLALGATVFDFLTLGLCFSWRSGTVTDDEGFVGEARLFTAQISGGAKIVAEQLGDFGAQAIGTAAVSKGTYKEEDNARHHVALNFKQLVSSRHPIIRKIFKLPPATLYANHLNRDVTLAAGCTGLDSGNELSEYPELVTRYNNMEDHIGRYFAVLGSTNAKTVQTVQDESIAHEAALGEARLAKSTATGTGVIEEPDALKPTPVKFVERSPGVKPGLVAAMTVTGGKGDFILGKLKSLELPQANDLLAVPSIAGELGLQRTSLEFERYQSSVQRTESLFRQHKKDPESGARQTIQDNLKEFERAATTLQKKLTAFKSKEESTTLWGLAGLDFGTCDRESFQRCLGQLKRDFNEYDRLQKQTYYGDLTTRASIDAFHKLYGVKNTEQFIACMTVLNGYFFNKLIADDLDKGDDNDGLATLRALREFTDFEKVLLSPTFRCDLTKVQNLCSFQTHGHLFTTDRTMKFLVNLPASLQVGTKGGVNATITVQWRTRQHHNIFRAGEYLDISVDVGGAVQPGAWNHIAGKLAEIPEIGISASDLESFSSSTSMGLGITRTFRFFKPSFFPELGLRKLFVRDAYRSGGALGLTGPGVDVGGGVKVNGGVSVDNSRTWLKGMQYGDRTFLHFALIYIHEFAAFRADFDKANEEALAGTEYVMPTNCYWPTVKQEQEKSLIALFNVLGNQESNDLKTELEEIAKKLVSSAGNGEGEQLKFATQLKKFIKAAQEFCQKQSTGEEGVARTSDAERRAYLTAVKEMEGLFRLYHPHIQARKGDAPGVYKQKALNLSAVSNVIKVPRAIEASRKIATPPTGTESGYTQLIDDEPIG